MKTMKLLDQVSVLIGQMNILQNELLEMKRDEDSARCEEIKEIFKQPITAQAVWTRTGEE